MSDAPGVKPADAPSVDDFPLFDVEKLTEIAGQLEGVSEPTNFRPQAGMGYFDATLRRRGGPADGEPAMFRAYVWPDFAKRGMEVATRLKARGWKTRQPLTDSVAEVAGAYVSVWEHVDHDASLLENSIDGRRWGQEIRGLHDGVSRQALRDSGFVPPTYEADQSKFYKKRTNSIAALVNAGELNLSDDLKLTDADVEDLRRFGDAGFAAVTPSDDDVVLHGNVSPPYLLMWTNEDGTIGQMTDNWDATETGPAFAEFGSLAAAVWRGFRPGELFQDFVAGYQGSDASHPFDGIVDRVADTMKMRILTEEMNKLINSKPEDRAAPLKAVLRTLNTDARVILHRVLNTSGKIDIGEAA